MYEYTEQTHYTKQTYLSRWTGQAYKFTYLHDNACTITFPGVRRIAWSGMTLQWNELPGMALKYGSCMMISIPLPLFFSIRQVLVTFLLADDPRKLPVDKQDGKKHC